MYQKPAIKKWMLNLPNILTLLRLALLPVIIWLLFQPENWAAYSALGLYVFGAITDWLDGWIARKYNQITEFGTFMDPISDKIFVSAIMLMLVATGRIEGLWVVLVILIFVREFTISGLREFLGPKNIKVPVSQLAKWKTAIQMIATGILIVGPYVPYGTLSGLSALSLATLLTLWTALSYLKTGFEHMKESS